MNRLQQDFLKSIEGLTDMISTFSQSMNDIQKKAVEQMTDEQVELYNEYKKSLSKLDKTDIAGLLKLSQEFQKKIEDADKQNKH